MNMPSGAESTAISLRRPSSPALRIALIYAAVSVIWIVFSDLTILAVTRDPKAIQFIGLIKGWTFVAATSVLLWKLVNHSLNKIEQSKAVLREREQLGRAILDSVSDAILICNPKSGRILDGNLTASRMFGYPPEQFPTLEIFNLLSHQGEFTLERARELVSHTPTSGLAAQEWPMKRCDGTEFWSEISARPVQLGNTSRLLVTVHDISNRKSREAKLVHQEALIREAGEIAHFGGWDYDPTSRLLTWSAETARIHGLDAESKPSLELGLSFFDEPSRHLLESAMNAAIDHAEPFDLELNIVTATGVNKSVRLIGRPVSRENQVVAVRGSIQDITGRKQFERELRESQEGLRDLLARLQTTREEERTRIAREVHDVLGQLLTGMKLDLAWMTRRLHRIGDEELRSEVSGKITGTTALIDKMLEAVQQLAQDLRPSLLDNVGLDAALKSEAAQFTERTGIQCTVIGRPYSGTLSTDCSTHVFRIFQEILTNVARHSKATKVTVYLSRSPDELTLKVEDNGCGISPEALHNPRSLGLLGMSERAALVDGRIHFEGQPGNGTTVTLSVPQNCG